MTIYTLMLALHNLLRWVVVLGGLYAIITSVQGLVTQTRWSKNHSRAGLIFTSSLHAQLVIGLLLYVVSPYIQGLMGNMSAAMRDTQARFFVVEHLTLMILAIIAAQLGYSLAKRAKSDRAKFIRATVGYVLAAVIILYAIPWEWRPLFRGF